MKNKMIPMAIIAAAAFLAVSFTTIKEVTKEIKVEKSQVEWKGYKVTGSHKGLIALKSGSLSFKEDKLVGGEFIIDMATLTNTDLDGDYKAKLEGHLKSDDFFGTATYPTATLVFTEATSTGKNAYSITGNLTIKGITKPITFVTSIYGNKATASIKVDRALYNVKYGSTSFFDDLKDKAIYDEFDLVADIEF